MPSVLIHSTGRRRVGRSAILLNLRTDDRMMFAQLAMRPRSKRAEECLELKLESRAASSDGYLLINWSGCLALSF
jgi:hypothetical protein